MRIVACGSINCSDKLIEVSEKLEGMGHAVDLPFFTKKIRKGEISLHDFCEKKEKEGDAGFRSAAGEDLIMRYFGLIREADCILVANVAKDGKENYIGGNVFLEMGFAYTMGKPIYLLNDIPNVSYRDEIVAMKPIVINGDFLKIR